MEALKVFLVLLSDVEPKTRATWTFGRDCRYGADTRGTMGSCLEGNGGFHERRWSLEA